MSYYQESKTRSILKGLSWRLIGTLSTLTIAYMMTGQISKAGMIAFCEFFLKFAIYYVHERAWLLVPVGSFQNKRKAIS
ncbi:DUF2061 domain-containing protein [Persicirhabdus sediminis]|uniref:DUF2061 domain-containing protein n=1 Tax=Persicirhabdus sediminis TaxID=454144 RepID=A0A8J7MF24_9BACT|nr:DUF2061 domain-containing protein [Persicirhabdus sediminis]